MHRVYAYSESRAPNETHTIDAGKSIYRKCNSQAFYAQSVGIRRALLAPI